MILAFRLITAMVYLLAAWAAHAEPIKLKLAFFSSDRSLLFRGNVKPFVDAVNGEARGLLEIEVFAGGTLGKVPAEQAELVLKGVADIAFIAPGYTAERFPDNTLIELPGLFRDQREASLVFTRMIAANALRGYEDFVVIGAYTVEPHSIHTRKPVASLADLRGLKIRTNNPIEARTFNKLGMTGVIMPVNQTADAIANATIDGGAVPPAMLGEFGIGRLTSYHYMIYADAPSLALVMNRKRFEGLPPDAQAIIRKYSGEWAVARSNAFFEEINGQALKKLQDDPKRRVVFPAAQDLQTIHAAFASVIADWEAETPLHAELLKKAESEIAKIRSGE